MSTISQSPAQPAIPNLLGGLVRQIGVGAHAVMSYWERRAAIKALRELDDRALRDIGIARCHIETAVLGGAVKSGNGRHARTFLRIEGRMSRSFADAMP